MTKIRVRSAIIINICLPFAALTAIKIIAIWTFATAATVTLNWFFVPSTKTENASLRCSKLLKNDLICFSFY
jgi:hypothetical protein